jgi:hypothetical protein
MTGQEVLNGNELRLHSLAQIGRQIERATGSLQKRTRMRFWPPQKMAAHTAIGA